VFRFPFKARGQSDDASAALPRSAVTVVPPVTMTVPSLAIAGDPTAQGMFARQRIVPSPFVAMNGAQEGPIFDPP
jgi:hypothetical protein